MTRSSAPLTPDAPWPSGQAITGGLPFRAESDGAARSIALLKGLLQPTAVMIGVVIYARTLEWVYSTLVSPSFDYIGYAYQPSGWLPSATATFMTVLVALCLPRTFERVSHVILWLLFAICVAPSMLMDTYTGYLTAPQAMALTAVLGTSFASVALLLQARLPLPRRRIRIRPRAVWLLISIYSALTYALMTATMGLSLKFVSFGDVYDVRGDFKDDLAGSGLLAYMISPQANIINPFLIAFGLLRKKWWLVGLGVCGQLLIYSASGLKTVLFATPAVLLIHLLFRRGRRPSVLIFVVGPTALMLAAAGADIAQGEATWTSLFSRRFLLTPGLLTSVYAQFFSENPLALLSHSVLRWWTEAPYDTAPPLVIGQFLQPGGQLAANANIFADGFANFGLAGVVGAAAALLVFLRLLDRAAAGLPLELAAMVMVMPSITLSNTALLTSLLSHGLAAGVALLLISPREPQVDSTAATVNHLPDIPTKGSNP